MPKLQPRERWKRAVQEGYAAFTASDERRRLRSKGLQILGRRKLLDSSEWWQASKGPMNTEEYRSFQRECREVGAKYGLAPWTIEMASLLRGYQPQDQPFPVEAAWPVLHVVTRSSDQLFQQWLHYRTMVLSDEMGVSIHFVVAAGQSEGRIVAPVVEPATTLSKSNKPPLSEAISLRLEIPVGYPPEAAAELGRTAAQFARELGRTLGYKVSQRMKGQVTTKDVSQLRLAEDHLPKNTAYDMVDDLYPEATESFGPAPQDGKLRSRVNTRRHRAKKRLRERSDG